MIDLSKTAARRRVLFGALYFSEGAPIGFLWWYLPTALRARGVAVDDITALTAAIALPWALKFLWAPLVDAVRTRRFSVRGWLIAAQLGMVATLVPLLGLDDGAGLETLLPVLSWVLVAHALCAATQDVAVDAWAIGATSVHERGAINASMQIGMLLGRISFSGGALALAEYVGMRGVVGALMVATGGSLVLAVLARASVPGAALGGRIGRMRTTLKQLCQRPSTWLGVIVALCGGAGFEAAGALAGPFLIDRGNSEPEVGRFFVVAALVSIPGAVLGGMLADRRGAATAARQSLLAMSAAVLLLAFVAATASRGIACESALALVYLALGAFTAASYALFMDLAPAALPATVFSAYMGLTNGCEWWAARLGGEIAAVRGYDLAFAVPAGLALLAWPALVGLSRRVG